MMSPVELRRILAEWRLRVHRVKDILQPASWDENEWRQFSQNLALLVREHGQSWIIDPNVYWDLRWNLQDGGELVCQVEHVPGERTSLVVAQNGGFASEVGSYTWLWAEFNMEGNFARDPYWVDGSWRDALTALLLPLDRRSSYMLASRAETPAALLLQKGARPNNSRFVRSLMPPYILDPEHDHGECEPSSPSESFGESFPSVTPPAPSPANESPATNGHSSAEPPPAESESNPSPEPASKPAPESDPITQFFPSNTIVYTPAAGRQGRILRERARHRYQRTLHKEGPRSSNRQIR
jgi:hypothetical protein